MDVDPHDLPLSARTYLPHSFALDSLLTVLDVLDTQVLILDRDSRVRFFNKTYLDAYAAPFREAGVPAEQILGLRIAERNDADHRWNTIRKAMETGTIVQKYYFHESDTRYSGFADLVPIETDVFSGIMVIQQEREKLRELSNQISHYKKLAASLQEKLDSKEGLPAGFQRIIGTSQPFVEALRIGSQVAPSGSSVCILGESGTGKEVFAEAIHYSSAYAQGPLVKVNCAAIPESLMESELFGYEKGAFTGANANGNPGKFELANNGTLFLDEVGEMPPSMQVKLLRALQEREITRIGGRKPIKLNFRLITATNRNLEEMVKEGTFREDLYYRICIIPLRLPPLRERRSDIPLLAQAFLAGLDLPQWKERAFSDEVLEQFMNYSWPGNIRELKNCVERMAILCPEEEIGTEYLPAAIANASRPVPGVPAAPDLSQYKLHDILDKVEFDTIRTVLSLTGGNKAKAIEILGISKRNFYLKLDKYGLR